VQLGAVASAVALTKSHLLRFEGSRVPKTLPGPRHARYYQTARTAHLERLEDKEATWFFYSAIRADFDTELAASLPYVQRVSALDVVRMVMIHRINILEVPEPLAIALWPHLFYIQGALAITNRLGLSRTTVVSYAIENYPTDSKLTEFTRIPRIVSRAIVKLAASFLIRTSSRIVFGTQDAADLYRSFAPRALDSRPAMSSLSWALPSPLGLAPENAAPHTLVFLGTFEDRKGIDRLMTAWPKVLDILPSSELTLLGKSGRIEDVREFAGKFDSVTLREDPPRGEIFDVLAKSKSLILFSQPSRGWKEQVGLPIVEALSVGCEIISSDQTGIHGWLNAHGHSVVAWDSSDEVLVAGIVKALTTPRSRTDVLRDLPDEDGRALADGIMFAAR
jgi:glycosyltransferase involved in cell wall biosynthesis